MIPKSIVSEVPVLKWCKRKYYYDRIYNDYYDEETAKAICLCYNPENKTVEELLQECIDSGDWKIFFI